MNTWATREHWGRESPLHSAYWSPELTAALLSRGAIAKVSDEYRLAAAKADYREAWIEFWKANRREPTDKEDEALGYDPKFETIQSPGELAWERLRIEVTSEAIPSTKK